MKPWNRFGQTLTIPIVAWTALALVMGGNEAFGAAYCFGACALVALLAQHQWGRA